MAKKKEKQISEYLPLTESSFYILLTLTQPLHGYAMMQEIEQLSKGSVTIGPGTLYGAFSTMEQEGLIQMVREEGRRKEYLLTSKGAAVLLEQIMRYETMLDNGRNIKAALKSLINKSEDTNERNRK
jgi:DNA-binding PadR family transcriptional regulator